jgi:hypothetical protein
MIQRSGKQGMGTTHFVQNNFYYDAFFLKATGMVRLLSWQQSTNLSV